MRNLIQPLLKLLDFVQEGSKLLTGGVSGVLRVKEKVAVS